MISVLGSSSSTPEYSAVVEAMDFTGNTTRDFLNLCSFLAGNGLRLTELTVKMVGLGLKLWEKGSVWSMWHMKYAFSIGIMKWVLVYLEDWMWVLDFEEERFRKNSQLCRREVVEEERRE